MAESFFASLKEELIHRRSWATRAQARRAVVEYIEVFFNRRRLHSSLGYLSPAEYEAQRSTTTRRLRPHNQAVRRTGSTPVQQRGDISWTTQPVPLNLERRASRRPRCSNHVGVRPRRSSDSSAFTERISRRASRSLRRRALSNQTW